MIEKFKIHIVKSLKFLILSFSIVYCVLSIAFTCEAKEITILYSGETHAMLYPCSCPIEPDGGVSRRAALIKELRKINPNALVVDSGGFFAGGLMDENTQNTQLDIERTKINLQAMKIMKYDAVNIGDDEFNFGKDFFEENVINKINLPVLSSGINSDKIPPFIIKDIEGIQVGIIGSCSVLVKQKAGGLEFIEPKIAVKKAVEELKKRNVNIIVLLSHQGESDDLNLAKDVPGLDIIIVGHSRSKEEPATKIGETLFLRPTWEGRRLGKLSLMVENHKIVNYKVEEFRLSDKINDDREIATILPRCFSDINCKKSGFTGTCLNPGQSTKADCLFTKAVQIELRVIAPKECKVCNPDPVINYLKRRFSGITVSYLYYPGKEAEKLIRESGIKTLPIFLISKEVEKEKFFNDDLKKNLESQGDFYMLKPQFGGISYLLEKKKIKGKLDVFMSLFETYAKDLLDLVKEYHPAVHFLATETEKGFVSGKGNLEVEEYLRSVCVQKYSPGYFYDYISCRVRNIDSSWWEDCAVKVDKEKIRACARGKEGQELLRENASLNKEMSILIGPVYLVDNKELFSAQVIPKKEEFKRFLED